MTEADAPPRYRPPAKVFCTFCMKSEEEVSQVVAGPANVFICDECVVLCSDYIAGRAPDRSGYVPPERQPSERLLMQIAPVEETLRAKYTQLQWLVATLRGRSVDWEAIGAALGVSAAQAAERFS